MPSSPSEPAGVVRPARCACANPLSRGAGACCATSLVLPGLLDVLRTNLRQGGRDVAVFELGRVFAAERAAGVEAAAEEPRLGTPAGGRPARALVGDARAARLLRRQGRAGAAGRRFGVPAPRLERAGASGTRVLHPGSPRSWSRCVRASAGLPRASLHPELVAKWELQGRAVVAEIDPARFDLRRGRPRARARSVPGGGARPVGGWPTPPCPRRTCWREIRAAGGAAAARGSRRGPL